MLKRPDRQAAAQLIESGAISCRPDDSIRSESAPEQIQEKWDPVSRPELRKNKKIELFGAIRLSPKKL
jgi:hypothetical protein